MICRFAAAAPHGRSHSLARPQGFHTDAPLRRSERRQPAGAGQKPYGILAPGPIGSVAAKAAEAPPAEDLWQFQDRKQWYEARFVAEDQPEWNPSRLIGSRSVGPGLTEVVLEVEASREKVPIRRAYKAVGQRCCVRVNGGVEAQLVTSTPPFPQSINRDVLLAVRGDIYAGATKQVREELSVMAKITLLLTEGEGADLKAAGEEDFIEVGPWSGTGLDLRGPICRFFRYPTVVILAAGSGIATAKALLEASDDVPSLLLPHRETSRLYYYAPNESSILYRDSFEEWEKAYNVRTMTTTRSFFDVFDDDDTLVYEPNSTAAVILTGGDEELEKQALQLCEEAEITCIVSDSQEQTKTRYLDSITIPQVEGVMHMHESENVSTDINADEDST